MDRAIVQSLSEALRPGAIWSSLCFYRFTICTNSGSFAMLSRICIWVRRRAQGHCCMLSWTTDDLVWTVDLKRRASNSLENWQTSLNINSLSSGNLLRLFLHHHPLGSATLWVGTPSPVQTVIETVSKMRLKKATNFNNNRRMTWNHLEGGK